VDRAEASRLAHGDRPLWNPLSEEALDEAISLLALRPGARVLDVACGRGEVLRRVAARYDVQAMGYDRDPALVEAAPPGLDIRVRDAPPDATFDLAICIASSHALGGFPDALTALHGLVEPGGQVLLGEGYWRAPPSDAYLDALGAADASELADYPGLMRAAEDAGLTPLHSSVASEADWDRYEWQLILNCERAGQPELRERAAAARRRVTMPGGRDTLGFALLLLRSEPRGPKSRIA
jgi:SAM-dependent methyltransferase